MAIIENENRSTTVYYNQIMCLKKTQETAVRILYTIHKVCVHRVLEKTYLCGCIPSSEQSPVSGETGGTSYILSWLKTKRRIHFYIILRRWQYCAGEAHPRSQSSSISNTPSINLIVFKSLLDDYLFYLSDKIQPFRFNRTKTVL